MKRFNKSNVGKIELPFEFLKGYVIVHLLEKVEGLQLQLQY